MTRSDAIRSSARAISGSTRSRHELPVLEPYRLDLTVTVLRRLATNVVDVLTGDGRYIRAVQGAHGIVIASVTQPRPDALTVTMDGDARDHQSALESVSRMLGVDRDVTPFDQAAARLSWLSPLAARMRGVKPPRYATLWEAFVNVVAFQQLSLQSASSIVRRLIVSSERAIDHDGVELYTFPGPGQLLAAGEPALRATGLSRRKLDTLRRAGNALATGRLDPVMLEGIQSRDAATRLQEIKGIGPWTAAVILLRGLGRLDVFPFDDTSVARNLSLVAGSARPDVDQVVKALWPQPGMLYYHLLLARLEARDELGRSSTLDGKRHR
jgi:DNA-3-methyladenine glycosylase II